jgi:hypothetical protein
MGYLANVSFQRLVYSFNEAYQEDDEYVPNLFQLIVVKFGMKDQNLRSSHLGS